MTVLPTRLLALDLSLNKNRVVLKKEYEGLHAMFRKQMCTGRTEKEFWKKFDDFRGDGYHVPIHLDGTLDKKTVAHFISEISNKRVWINKEIDSLKEVASFNNLEKKLSVLEKMFEEHISLKEKYYDMDESEAKDLLGREANKKFKEFRLKVRDFLSEISFLHSFRFPVDHYAWRKRYDELKERHDYWGKHEANKIFFARKIIQDGAQNSDRSDGDNFLRAAIDTAYISLRDYYEPFVSEMIRSDLNYVFKKVKPYLRMGPSKQKERLYEWLDRTGRYYKFYDDLLNNSDVKTGSELLEARAKSRFALKDFVLQKQEEAYTFWQKKEEIFRYLYVVDTILFNEVGNIDGRDALERRDIVRVVINRHDDDYYSMFDKLDDLFEKFSTVPDEEVKKNKWLNVLFKEGEFSFTYYFIKANLNVFCQPMTKLGQSLRSENIDLALDVLKEYNSGNRSKHIRYFSRASMLGRIDMSSLWSGKHDVVPEKVGAKLDSAQTKSIKTAISTKKYGYRYDFVSEDNKKFKVIEVGDNGFVISRDDGVIYKQRNPHLFTYFSKK